MWTSKYEKEITKTLEKFAAVDASTHDVLKFLGEQLQSDEAHFWNRFTALAALHAGLLVVAVATSEWARLLICFLGIALAVLWCAIQERSAWYVDRWKPMFHGFRKAHGLFWEGEPQSESNNSDFRSSTQLAMVAPFLILFPWLVLLFLASSQISGNIW